LSTAVDEDAKQIIVRGTSFGGGCPHHLARYEGEKSRVMPTDRVVCSKAKLAERHLHARHEVIHANRGRKIPVQNTLPQFKIAPHGLAVLLVSELAVPGRQFDRTISCREFLNVALTVISLELEQAEVALGDSAILLDK
jgi:hypothetical protein